MKKRLQILSIVPFPLLPVQSGGQQKTFQLLKHLSAFADITCITSLANNDLPKNLPAAFNIGGGLASNQWRYLDFSAPFRFVGLLRRHDLLMVDQPFWAGPAMLLAGLAAKPLVLHTHNIEFERFKSMGKSWWRLLKPWELLAMKRADFVLFITEEDRLSAIKTAGIAPEKTFVAGYGTHRRQPPPPGGQRQLRQRLGLHKGPVFLYYGQLGYQPNAEGAAVILRHLLPRLQQEVPDCQVVIAGKGLPKHLAAEAARHPRVIAPGFVEKLDDWIMAADVVLNPILTGGGIKTKVIDALALNATVISTQSGAWGVNRQVCGGKLKVVQDSDWQEFTRQMRLALKKPASIPEAFYRYYYFGTIAERLHKALCQYLELKKPSPNPGKYEN